MGLADSEVGVKVVAEGVGPVTTTDIDTASATGACILAFNVKYANAAVEGVAKVQAVQVVEHRIIYRMLEEVSIVPSPSRAGTATSVLGCAALLCCSVLCYAVPCRAVLCWGTGVPPSVPCCAVCVFYS